MITLTIGRKSDCDIVLTAETISRRHAELHVVSEGRFVIEDNGSTSGTFLKDGRSWRRVSRSTVTSSDVVKFGDLQIGVAELLTKAGRQVEGGDVVEVSPKPKPGSRFERDPETGLIREKK